MKFSAYSLAPELVGALERNGYVVPTPVQERTLVAALRGRSLIVKAETGSGKTHAFLIPVIQNLDAGKKKLQAIVLEPTVELCLQCQKFAQQLAAELRSFRVLVDAGAPQKDALTGASELPSVLIATPGKLKEAVFLRKSLDVSDVRMMVLDEADMLLEGEQSQDVIALTDRIAPSQKLIFTATMKEHQIASLKKVFSINESVDVDRKYYASRNVSHHFVDIKHRDAADALMVFLKAEQPYFTLVFASRKSAIAKLYHRLCEAGIRCGLLTSDMTPSERKNALRRISEGEYQIVLCSDLASRGLDFEKVSHVISLDLPQNLDYYYHRAGRTGRYKERGDSYVFYDDELNKKAKETLEKKLSFDYLILRQEGLKPDKKRTPQMKKRNEKLEAEIHREVAKVRSDRVKPNYKKKMRRAVEKAKKNHKRRIVMENLRSKKKAMAYKDD